MVDFFACYITKVKFTSNWQWNGDADWEITHNYLQMRRIFIEYHKIDDERNKSCFCALFFASICFWCVPKNNYFVLKCLKRALLMILKVTFSVHTFVKDAGCFSFSEKVCALQVLSCQILVQILWRIYFKIRIHSLKLHWINFCRLTCSVRKMHRFFYLFQN